MADGGGQASGRRENIRMQCLPCLTKGTQKVATKCCQVCQPFFCQECSELHKAEFEDHRLTEIENEEVDSPTQMEGLPTGSEMYTDRDKDDQRTNYVIAGLKALGVGVTAILGAGALWSLAGSSSIGIVGNSVAGGVVATSRSAGAAGIGDAGVRAAMIAAAVNVAIATANRGAHMTTIIVRK